MKAYAATLRKNAKHKRDFINHFDQLLILITYIHKIGSNIQIFKDKFLELHGHAITID